MSTGDDNQRANLRQQARAARRNLSASDRAAASARICAQLQSLPVFAEAQRIGAYFAVSSEITIADLIGAALYCSKQIYLPRVGRDRSMQFAVWRGAIEDLMPNAFGIGEPSIGASEIDTAALDVILLPLVAFDRRGYRLGSGAGYYDRALALRLLQPPPPWLIGVAHSCQEVADIPQAAWDVPLDWIVTEREIIAIASSQG